MEAYTSWIRRVGAFIIDTVILGVIVSPGLLIGPIAASFIFWAWRMRSGTGATATVSAKS